MYRIINISLFGIVCAYSLNTFAQPKGLNSFLRGEDPSIEITSLLSAFHQPSTPLAPTLDSITLESSVDGGSHVIHHSNFASISALSPTIGQYISQLNESGESGTSTIPLPVSNQSLELLIQSMQGVGSLELVAQLLQRGFNTDAALQQLENEAAWLQSTSLREVIVLAKRECETYFGSSEQASESEEESSSEEKVLTVEDLFPKGINTVFNFEELKILDSVDSIGFKGKDLQKYISIVHHMLVRCSQAMYHREHGGPLDIFALGMVLKDDKFPYDPNHLSFLAQQFLVEPPEPSYTKDFLFSEYGKKSELKKLIFVLENNVQEEICHFEGVLAEVFCKDDQIKQILSYLTKSCENYINAQKEILKLTSSGQLNQSQINGFLETKSKYESDDRIGLIRTSIKAAEDFIVNVKGAYPNLMTLYLISQQFIMQLDQVVRIMETKPNRLMSLSRCKDQKLQALMRARYFGLEIFETALPVMKPFVDQFLQIVGEEPSVIPVMQKELRESARFHAKLVETAQKELKNVPQPKPKQVTAPKKPASPVQEQVASPKAKRPQPRVQYSEPEVKFLPPKLPERKVESTTEATKTVKSEKPDPKKPKEKRGHKKTEEERAQESALKKQKVMDEYNAEREQREKERALFRVVLSPDEAKLVISGLSKNHKNVLDYIFAQPTPHLILTDKHFTLLAKGIQKQMNLVLGKESTAFMDAIEERIHYAHDSKDSGDKLPSHYIDILRTVFIIFGLIPEGWESKTREDRAIAKRL